MTDIVIAGFGTVGQGFAEVLAHTSPGLREQFGPLRLVGAFDSRSYAYDTNGLDPVALLESKAAGRVGKRDIPGTSRELLDEMDYDILVEVTPTDIGDGGSGMGHILSALGAGRHVITCNKGPLSLRFQELEGLATRRGAMLRFEGSVGGAMPIIHVAKDIMAGEDITSIKGILNGTCNFILHRMGNEGLPFQQALREAQQLGYAEADPTYDIEGVDSACKVAILSNAIFGRDVTVHDVMRVGISSVTDEAIALAREQGQVLRLIGEVGQSRLEVAPRLVPIGHPLAIGGTLNIAQIDAKFSGPITVAGRGAGRMETASAILSDLMTILRAQ